MANTVVYSNEKDPSLNTIYYGIAKQILKEMLNKKLISQEEFYEIDALNQSSFYQNLSSFE